MSLIRLPAIIATTALISSVMAQSRSPNATLTAVPGIKVGHYTLSERPTGCTVVLAEAGVTAAVDVRGAAPATRETDVLDPVNSVQIAHAIVLAGGSAYGLDSASGVMRYLEEKRIGFAFGNSRVPIVPAAALFDLGVGDGTIRPAAECGYRAAAAASSLPVTDGSIGAGAGATIGKADGPTHAMKAGVGSASIELPNGLIVSAMVVVNAFGDVIDPASGTVVAGVRKADGRTMADARALLRSGAIKFPSAAQNTTLGVIATNASVNKTEAKRIAQMAHDGFARAIAPVHTPVDGDTIFVLATGSGTVAAEVGQIGALAADVMASAIVRAAHEATSIPGYPALRDLR
jgi:L-aminopeptidase/D-esterase-like protein